MAQVVLEIIIVAHYQRGTFGKIEDIADNYPFAIACGYDGEPGLRVAVGAMMGSAYGRAIVSRCHTHGAVVANWICIERRFFL